ncbi:conserved hypothetical protein [endosymbiont of unidentified scaly snail isolate Monju]|nr:conserved hypothetical protein [endosymbiont of unidentified scaly snail isolate Monju]
MHARGLALVVNRLFADALDAGELDFLEGKVLHVEVEDVGLHYRLVMRGGRFAAAAAEAPVDVGFRGELQTFLQLAARREDADTLFFQRRLRIEGDTATGLHLKNFPDAREGALLPPALQYSLERMTDLYGRYCGREDVAAV